MISSPDWRAFRAVLAMVAGLGLLSGGSGGADEGTAANLKRDAYAALSRGDGIAAEVALRKAMVAGLPAEAVAARMGEAMLAQGDLRKARDWLGPGRFTTGEAAHGWRMRGRLEMAEGRLAEAGRAFDAALRLTPQDSRLWVDIARLRYLGGEQMLAVAAVDRAVALDPANVRALELRGLMLRDAQGPLAAIPWFEAGLKLRPDDAGLLGSFAASLGELGRAREMLTVTRRMIALDPHNPQAFYLQAVLAARAGDVPLARRLLDHAGPSIRQHATGLLLAGAMELEAGNSQSAVVLFERLVAMQPNNRKAGLLLARALAAAGDDAELLARFAAAAEAPDASPYLLTLVGRAYERQGARDQAAPLLDRAAQVGQPDVVWRDGADRGAAGDIGVVRQWLAAGQLQAARSIAEQAVERDRGSWPALVLAGDVRFVQGDLSGALAGYRRAADIRMTDQLMLRLQATLLRAGETGLAQRWLDRARASFPGDPLPARLASVIAARSANWSAAAALLDDRRWGTRVRDWQWQADRAVALARAGQGEPARSTANGAYQLQPAARITTLAFGLAMSKAGGAASAMRHKATALGATPSEAVQMR